VVTSEWPSETLLFDVCSFSRAAGGYYPTWRRGKQFVVGRLGKNRTSCVRIEAGVRALCFQWKCLVFQFLVPVPKV
jgi:hypothetical protein